MIAAADVAFARGWDLIKVYTMIGLPTETVADLDELVTLVEGILAQGRKHGRKNVNVSVGSFVPKSWTPFQWAPFDGVETLERKLAYLKEKFRRIRGAKMKWHEPREAEIECVLSRGDRRVARILHTAWKSGVRFDGWTEHFRHDLWIKAFEAEGIPKDSYLRAYDLDEILPWDVLDVSIKKRWLQIELIKAKKEMRTEDCKWGHCYACGVPGNGEDTVLAKSMNAGALPAFDAAAAPASDPAAYRDVAKGAAYREKAMPDLPAASRVRGGQGETPVRHRISFSKTGDARLLSHRNTMDVLERAIRAAGLPARYTEGFNPHMKLSMGPALALGLESRHEVFDVDGRAAFPLDAAGRINAKLPAGVEVLEVRALGIGEPSLAKAVKGARYSVRLDSEEHVERAAGALENSWRESMPALRAIALEADASGASLTFEVNLDQAAGETRPRRRRSSRRCSRFLPRSRPGCRSPARPPSSRDELPRHRDGPVRGRAQPDRLRRRARAPARPLVPGRGGPGVGEAPAVRPGRGLHTRQTRSRDHRQRVRLQVHQRPSGLPRPEHLGREPGPILFREAGVLGRSRVGPGRRGHRLGGTREPGHFSALTLYRLPRT